MSNTHSLSDDEFSSFISDIRRLREAAAPPPPAPEPAPAADELAQLSDADSSTAIAAYLEGMASRLDQNRPPNPFWAAYLSP